MHNLSNAKNIEAAVDMATNMYLDNVGDAVGRLEWFGYVRVYFIEYKSNNCK